MNSIRDISDAPGRLQKAFGYVKRHYPRLEAEPRGYFSEGTTQVLSLLDNAGCEHQLRVFPRTWFHYHRVIRADGVPMKRADAEAYMDLLR
ncbi:MAG TPA: hypothetical protein VJB05_02270 [archaeon]|nr:hypothetical protein [archaeon]